MATKKIEGTPTAAGTYTFTAKAQNAYGADERTYTVTIAAKVYTWKKYAVTQEYIKENTCWKLKGYRQPPNVTIQYYYKNTECPFSSATGFYNEGAVQTRNFSEGNVDRNYYYIAEPISATENKMTRFGPWENTEYPGGWAIENKYIKAIKTNTRGTYISDVTSTNRNAYPNNGEQGEFWYVFVK